MLLWWFLYGIASASISVSFIFTFNYKTTQSSRYKDHVALSLFQEGSSKHLVSDCKYTPKNDNTLLTDQ